MATVLNSGIIGSILDKPLGRSNKLQGTKSFAVVPSDTVNFTRIPRKLQSGTAGTITVVNMDDTTTQFTVAVGDEIDQMCKRVNATGTAATLIRGIF